jgi:hypothetical protein
VRPTSERALPIGHVIGRGQPVRPRGRDRVDRTCPGPRVSRRSKPAKAGPSPGKEGFQSLAQVGREAAEAGPEVPCSSAEATPAKAAPLGPLGATEDARGSEASGLLPQPTGAGGLQRTTAVERSGCRAALDGSSRSRPGRIAPGVRRQRRSSANSLRPPSKSRPEDERCRPLRRKRRVVAHAAERSWETPAVATPAGK